MGRLDVSALRFMSAEEFRVLKAVELGMRNHQLVSGQLVTALANIRTGGTHKLLRQLQNQRLLAYERGRRYDGYRLTVLGYDYLALHSLTSGGHVDAFGSQIGTGKESDVYAVYDNCGEALALKFHRLGRTSFRRLKLLRDYHAHRRHTSWLYISNLSAAREFAFMQALYSRNFPVPRPIQRNRHAVLMSLVDGVPLCRVAADPVAVDDNLDSGEVVPASGVQAEDLFRQCMRLMVRLAECGVVHCDFNEFNLMVTADQSVVLIDLPQMVSTSHPNARELFDRDVECLQRFFARRFHFSSEEIPLFEDIVRREDLDAEVRASGYAEEFGDGNCSECEQSECSDDESQEEENSVPSETNGQDEPGETANMIYSVERDLEKIHLDERGGDGSREIVTASDSQDDGAAQDVEEIDTATEQNSCSPIGTSVHSTVTEKFSSEQGVGDDDDDDEAQLELDGFSDEEPEDAVSRCRRLKQRRKQLRQQQQLEERSRLKLLVAASTAERLRQQDSANAASVASSCIEPEQLSHRLRLQQRRREHRQNVRRLRVKGEASAVTRVRRNNAANVRECTSGFWAGAY